MSLLQLIFGICFLNLFWKCESKTIDNKLIGTPKVTCGPEAIAIEGETADVFEGTVFVKHWRRNAGCATAYRLQQNSTHPRFAIPLDRLTECGLEIRRNPVSKELEIFTVFVFSFHPNFVTAGDRSFAVHCIFVQQQLTVATKFSFISDISTKAIVSGVAKAAKVVMSIQADSLAGVQPSNTVSVGEKLLYLWKIDEDSEVYGLRVHQCYAETRDGNKMVVVDNGCSVDSELITHPKYSDNSLKAFASGHAFKYPDSDEIIITCVVETCIRRFEHLIVSSDRLLCDSPPKCDERRKRSISGNGEGMAEIYGAESLVHQSLHVIGVSKTQSLLQSEGNTAKENVTLCMEKVPFAAMSAVVGVLYIIAISITVIISLGLYKSQQYQCH